MTSRTDADQAVEAEDRHGAHNYDPLRIVLCRGEGVWVRDVEDRRYFDALSAYSAMNFGHRHPRLVRAATEQLERLTLTSRAFHNDQLGPFCAELAEFCGQRSRAADEHGRRGGRDGDQARAKVGLRAQGRRTGSRRDRRVRRQLPWPHDHDRRLLRRPAGADRLRPLRSRVRPGALRRPGRAALGRRREHRRLPRRADPRGGRSHHPARRLPRRRAVDLRRGRRPARRRRGPVRSRPRRPALRVRPRARAARPLPARQGARRGHPAGLGGRGHRRGPRRPPPRRARQHVRRQPARLRRRPRGPAPAGRRPAHRRVRGAGRRGSRPAARRRPPSRARGAPARPVARDRAGRATPSRPAGPASG